MHGSPADLPLLEMLKAGPSSVRTLERMKPGGKEKEKGQQEASAPLPSGWNAVRTESIRSLAEEAETSIRKEAAKPAAQK